MKWNNLETLPETDTLIWVLNFEYERIMRDDKFTNGKKLSIRPALYYRFCGWQVEGAIACVAYWCYPPPTEELPALYETSTIIYPQPDSPGPGYVRL
jgi:hypothetical protein